MRPAVLRIKPFELSARLQVRRCYAIFLLRFTDCSLLRGFALLDGSTGAADQTGFAAMPGKNLAVFNDKDADGTKVDGILSYFNEPDIDFVFGLGYTVFNPLLSDARIR